MSNAAPQPMNQQVLLREDSAGITTLTLNRPDKFNALSNELLDALQTEFDRIANDKSVKVVVVAANGRAFCTGHDLKEMRANPERDQIKALFSKCGKMMQTIVSLPQPVIAKVQGVATAAGCQLVATCDLAIAAEGVKFAVSGVNLGLFCSTPMVALSRNLSRKKAMELLLSGDFIEANKAQEYGLVNQVAPADDLHSAVTELADKIAQKSTAAIALGKDLFYRQLEASLADAYSMASETMACNMMEPDAQNGIDAFLSKQPMPEWKGR